MTGYLYRFTDEAGAALYIGSTTSIHNRLKQHAGQPYWTRVVGIEVRRFTSIEAARDEETRLLKAERPELNVKGVPGRWPNHWDTRRAHLAGQRCQNVNCSCNRRAAS